MSHTGFITFDSVATAMMCAQTLLDTNSDQFKVKLAPGFILKYIKKNNFL